MSDYDYIVEAPQDRDYCDIRKFNPYHDSRGKFSTGNGLTDEAGNGIMESGAISGARNPFSDEAKEHAERYYAFIRSIKTDVPKIAKNTGFDEETIRSIKQYLFIDEHELSDGIGRFYPDYMIAESWRRLFGGKDIQPHDITLLRHEKMESELMKQGLTQEEAHEITSLKYNYQKESEEFYGTDKKHSGR